MKPSALLVFLALPALDGCASTGTGAPQATQTASATPRRARRHRTPAPEAGTAAGTAVPAPAVAATLPPEPAALPAITNGLAMPSEVRPPAAAVHGTATSAFGSPVVTSSGNGHELTPRWIRSGRRSHLVCDGEVSARVASTQSPYEPSNASTIRAFLPAEHPIVACHPPATPNGRLPVRGVFASNGAPEEFYFTSVEVDESRALCIGRALCDIRLPPFRSVNTSINYDYVVALPSDEE